MNTRQISHKIAETCATARKIPATVSSVSTANLSTSGASARTDAAPRRDEPQPSLLQSRIDQYRTQLTKSDELLLGELLAHPTEAALWRGRDLARRVGLHASSATRLAQHLGYRGYMELRRDLHATLTHTVSRLGAGDRVREQLDHAQGTDILRSFVDREVAALAALPQHITQTDLDRVADALATAGHIFVFAAGNATALSEVLVRRLRRFGLRSYPLRGSHRDIAEAMLSMGPHDCLVLCAFRTKPKVFDALNQAAHQRGVHRVLLSDVLRTVDPQPEAELLAPRGGSDGFNSLTVPMAIINTLILTIAARHGDQTLTALDQLDGLISTFESA